MWVLETGTVDKPFYIFHLFVDFLAASCWSSACFLVPVGCSHRKVVALYKWTTCSWSLSLQKLQRDKPSNASHKNIQHFWTRKIVFWDKKPPHTNQNHCKVLKVHHHVYTSGEAWGLTVNRQASFDEFSVQRQQVRSIICIKDLNTEKIQTETQWRTNSK